MAEGPLAPPTEDGIPNASPTLAVAAVAADSSPSCRIFHARPLTWLQRHLLYRQA